LRSSAAVLDKALDLLAVAPGRRATTAPPAPRGRDESAIAWAVAPLKAQRYAADVAYARQVARCHECSGAAFGAKVVPCFGAKRRQHDARST
jgi:hypothetical protein